MSPKVTLLIVTDGRGDYLARTWESAQANLKYDWHEIVVVDDSASNGHSVAVSMLTRADHVLRHKTKRGGAAAIRTAWEYLRTTDTDYIFHLEDDFIFPEPIAVADLVRALETNPTTLNVVLRRQPWGGEGGRGPLEGLAYVPPVEGPPLVHHTRGFWLNPCIYRRNLTEREWPEHGHEHHFTTPLIAEGYDFAFYGTLDDPPRCHHIGEHRSAAWTW